jgi:uncharacterized repeat protein (TIGR03803 family)
MHSAESNSRSTKMPAAALTLALLSALLLIATRPAHAQTYSVLYSFTGKPDGANPYAGLALDKQGNLYGTTYVGGVDNLGTVFKIPSSGGETVLYSFKGGSGNGGNPHAGVTLDTQGNLYGTTWSYSLVFKLDTAGNETVIGVAPGADPSGVVLDSQGNLYGTTEEGGANNGQEDGTVFKLDQNGDETILHTFRTGRTDGTIPRGGVVFDSEGNLYGVTTTGGSVQPNGTGGDGTVFKLVAADADAEDQLASFTGTPTGAKPYAGVVLDTHGNIYGTTYEGGTYGFGTVFKLDTSGNLTALYSFGSISNDGKYPEASVVLDSHGNLYGTTTKGGTYGDGTVFEIDTGGNETVLHNFGATKDGKTPYSALVFDKHGNLYGTTYGGGVKGHGTVFKLTPG